MSLKLESPLPASPAPQAAHVALLWVDNANLTRCHVVPMRRFAQPKFQLELTNAVQSIPSMYDVSFDSPVGAVRWVPDHQQNQHKCSSTSDNEELSDVPVAKLYDISAWMDGARACFGDMVKDGEAWEQCPRSFLRSQERKLLKELGIQPTIGFELEFQLLRPSGRMTTDGNMELVPVDSTLYSEVRALQSGASWKVLSQIVECLENDLGITVYQYHAESASGQFEISIGYDPNSSANDGSIPSLVDAVDQLVLARQTVHGIAVKHGLQATFVPKLKLNEPGSGAHIHLGLLDLLPNTNANGGTSSAAAPNLFQSRAAVASAFIAGVLEELPGMLMLLAPSVNSFERLKPQCWAGAYNCYGFENREAAIRLIGSNVQDVTRVDHFEIKAVDATANPYVAVGTLLAVGIAGIERKLKLPAAMTRDPATLNDSSKEKQPHLLPQSLQDAIQAFKERSEFWNSVLSVEYADLLVRLREAENEFYGKLTRDEKLQQLVRRY